MAHTTESVNGPLCCVSSVGSGAVKSVNAAAWVWAFWALGLGLVPGFGLAAGAGCPTLRATGAERASYSPSAPLAA